MHPENERHTAWERYVDEKPLGTAAFREEIVTTQWEKERETSKTTATA